MTDLDVRRIEDKVDNVALVLAELRGSLSPTLERLTEGQIDLAKDLTDYRGEVDKRFEKVEENVGALQRFRYSIPSLAVLAVLLDVALALYYITHPH